MNSLLLPVVAVQAMWKRHRKVEVPAADGDTSGIVLTGGSACPLRIAVLGDSISVGYGVHRHEDGFGGALAGHLAERTGRSVEWTVTGQYGATARRIRHRLLPRITEPVDIAVLTAGPNDVLCDRKPEQWREDLAAIVDSLSGRATQVMVAGIPPFAQLPCMPRLLGRHLAGRAEELDRVSREVCDERPFAGWVDGKFLLPFVPEYFAADGFHPSAIGYRRWAGSVADEIPSPVLEADCCVARGV